MCSHTSNVNPPGTRFVSLIEGPPPRANQQINKSSGTRSTSQLQGRRCGPAGDTYVKPVLLAKIQKHLELAQRPPQTVPSLWGGEGGGGGEGVTNSPSGREFDLGRF